MLVIFLISMCVVVYAIYSPGLDQIKEIYRDFSSLWQTSAVVRQAAPIEPSRVESSTVFVPASKPVTEHEALDVDGSDVLDTATEEFASEIIVDDTAENSSFDNSTSVAEYDDSVDSISNPLELPESSSGSTQNLSASLPANIEVEPAPALVTVPEPERLPDSRPVLIDFAFDSADLAPVAQDMLETIVNQLQQFRAYSAAIRGYSDSRGEPTYNLELSRRRAVVVAEYMVKGGIDAGRLSVEGRGVDYNEESNFDAADGPEEHERRVVQIEIHRTTSSL